MYKKIHIRMLYYLTENPQTVTSVSLAKFLERSARTIKNEMQELRRISPEFGVEIITKRGKGYQANIVDEELFISMYEKYLNSVNYSEHTNNLKLERTDYLISLLLNTNEVITLDDIEEKMFLSKNSFKDELADAIKFIESYNIEVNQKIGLGISLSGTEEQYRLAFTEMLGMYFTSYETLEQNMSLQVFKFDYHQRQELRYKFLNILRHRDISISDDAIQRISIYFIVSINRISQGFYLEDTESELEATHAFMIAKEIVDEIQQVVDVRLGKGEIIQITKLILVNSYEYQKFNEPYFNSSLQKATSLLTEVVNENKKLLFNLDVQDLTNTRLVLTKMLMSADFGMERAMFSPLRKRHTPYCHTSCLIATRIKILIEQKLDINFSDRFDSEMEKAIMIAIDGISLDYDEATIAVVSNNGKEYAKYLASKVNDKFSDLVKHVEYHELYELRDTTPDDVQLLISDVDETMYRYMLPHYSMSGYEITLDEYRSIAIILVKLMYKIFDDLLEADIEFHDILEVESTKELTKMLSFLYGNRDYSFMDMQLKLEQYLNDSKMNIDSDVVVITLEEEYNKEPFIHVYEYPSTDGKKYIVTVHVGENSKIKLKHLTIFVRTVMSNYEAIELWKNTKDFNAIFDLIAEQILLENQNKSII